MCFCNILQWRILQKRVVPDEGYYRNAWYQMKDITETRRTRWRLLQKHVVPDEGYYRNTWYQMKVIKCYRPQWLRNQHVTMPFFIPRTSNNLWIYVHICGSIYWWYTCCHGYDCCVQCYRCLWIVHPSVFSNVIVNNIPSLYSWNVHMMTCHYFVLFPDIAYHLSPHRIVVFNNNRTYIVEILLKLLAGS
jgi:hypothetical protein